MSRYAFDEEHHPLIVRWETGVGDTAGIITELDPTIPNAEIQRLAHALTGLSAAAWRT